MNPFTLNLSKDLDLFNDFYPWKDVSRKSKTTFHPSYHIEEFQNSYQIDMDLPGMKKKDIHLEIDENILKVKGERKTNVEEKKDGKVILKEKSRGEFFLQFTLPKNIDFAKVKASYEEGVLCLKLPKTLTKKKTYRKDIS